jgi:hypothetical protein
VHPCIRGKKKKKSILKFVKVYGFGLSCLFCVAHIHVDLRELGSTILFFVMAWYNGVLHLAKALHSLCSSMLWPFNSCCGYCI